MFASTEDWDGIERHVLTEREREAIERDWLARSGSSPYASNYTGPAEINL